MNLRRFPDIETSARALADEFEAFCESHTGMVGLVLPGGRSPVAFLRALAARRLPWDRILVTVGDERCVPPASPDSNAGQIRRVLIEDGGAPARITSWLEETAPPETLAEEASERLKDFPWRAGFAIVGTAADGHFASLFPATPPTTRNASGPVVATRAPSPPWERLSLTLPAFLSCGRLTLLVYGREKQAALQAAQTGAATPLGDLLARVPDLLVHCVEDAGA
jgi:6-phosphogluconolactonase